MVEGPSIVTQPHLGKRKEVYKPESNMQGYMAIARVLRIHHKNSTADVQIINTGDVFSCGTDKQGKYAPLICTTDAGYDKTSMTSWGTIEPIIEGQLVVLAFLDHSKSKPIILASVHDTENIIKNVLPSLYPLDTTESTQRKEARKHLKVFPSQLYHRVDGDGGVEISHPSKTFLKMDTDPYNVIDDSHDGFDHERLSEMDPVTSQVRCGKTEETSFPLNILFSHRTSSVDEDTTWTKAFLSKDGMLRLTRDNRDGKLSYFEVGKSGGMKMRRQMDSATHNSGNLISEVKVNEDGSCTMSVTSPMGSSSINVTNNSMSLNHPTGSYISMDKDGNIMIHSKRHIIMTEEGI
ncbi:MAG: hypothetical protein Q8910_00870 [Bacteroidota bacterium]|nr:hypothetical protein [Bacteroidota bacterium]